MSAVSQFPPKLNPSEFLKKYSPGAPRVLRPQEGTEGRDGAAARAKSNTLVARFEYVGISRTVTSVMGYAAGPGQT